MSTDTKWLQTKSGIVFPSEPPKETVSTETDVPRKKYLRPTLDWFLGLEVAQQEEIFHKLKDLLLWSGRLKGYPFGGGSLDNFFKALEDAGAAWEEYC